MLTKPLNLALGNTSKEKGIKIANIKDETDRMAVVAVLENIMIASAQPQITSDASPKIETRSSHSCSFKVETPTTPATPAKPADAPTAPEKKPVDTKSLESFLKTYKHNGDNFGAELQKIQKLTEL